MSDQVLIYSSYIIIKYIYHALINTLNTHITRINLNTFYTYIEGSPTKTIYIKHSMHTYTYRVYGDPNQ